MPPPEPFVSYAPNREDVVLWRALGNLPTGRYVELRASASSESAVGRAFEERGWERDSLAPDADDRRAEPEIHFAVVEVEAGELPSMLDLGRRRPWVLVVSTADGAPLAAAGWERDVLAAGYRFCLYDGVSRYYVADVHRAELGEALSFPACTRDDYVRYDELAARREAAEHKAASEHWRALALSRWGDVLAGRMERTPSEHVQEELLAMQRTLSWRVTRPLRLAQPLVARIRAR